MRKKLVIEGGLPKNIRERGGEGRSGEILW